MYAEAPFRPSRFLRLAVLAEEGHWHHAHGWNSEGILREVATCTGHHFVHSVLCRLGADQRVCAAIPRVVSSERHANGLPRCGSGSAGFTNANCDRHARRPVRRAFDLHLADDDRGGASFSGSESRHVSRPARRGLFSRHCRELVCRRRRFCVALVPAGKTRGSAGRLRSRKYWAIRSSVSRACAWGDHWLAEHLPRRIGPSRCVGSRLLRSGEEFAPSGATIRAWRNALTAGTGETIVGALTFLLSDLRWIRRFLDLFASSFEGPIRVEGDRCGIPDCRFRSSRDACPSPGGLARRQDRRCPGLERRVSRHRAIGAVDGLAVDAALYGRRARLRIFVGRRKRSGVQTRAAVFSETGGHRHGTRRRHGRARRIFPAPATRFLPRSSPHGLAGLSPVVANGGDPVACKCSYFSSATGKAGTRPPTALAQDRRPLARRRNRDALYRPPRCSHRRGVAQFAELRPGACDLHFRDHLRHVGRGVSLSRLARQASHARILGARLATLLAAGNSQEFCSSSRARGEKSRSADLHPQTVGASLVDASTDFLGLCHRGPDHVSVSLRMDLFPDAPQRSKHLRRARLRLPRHDLPAAHLVRRIALSRAGYFRVSGAGRNRLVIVAALPRSWRTGGAVVLAGFPPYYSAVRHFSNRPRADRLATLASRGVLQFPRHPARHYSDQRTALFALRQVLPHFPASGATGGQALPGGR